MNFIKQKVDTHISFENIYDMTLLDKIEKKSEKLSKCVKEFKMFYDVSYDEEAAQEVGSKIINNATDIYHLSRNIYKEFRHDFAKINLVEIEKDRRVVINKEKDYIHIILPELFPRRMKNGRTDMDLDYIRSMYEYSFKEFENPIKYQDRVAIIYKSHFCNKRNMVDDDNFDTKILTDYISEYFLADDNPERVLKIYDYCMDERNYSEAFVMDIQTLHNNYSKWIIH